MPLRLPAGRSPSVGYEQRKPNVPTDEIINVEGQSPLAVGVETAGKVLTQALTERRKRIKDANAVAKIEETYGLKPGTFAKLDPATANVLAEAQTKQKDAEYEKAIKKANLVREVENLKKGTVIVGANGELNYTAGAEDVSVEDDERGNPRIVFGANYRPPNTVKMMPNSGKGTAGADILKRSLTTKYITMATGPGGIVEQTQAAQEAINLANRGETTADKQLAYALVKVAEGRSGRVSDSDVANFDYRQLGNVGERVYGYMLKAVKGETYPPAIREEIKNMVKQQLQTRIEQFNRNRDVIVDTAVANGLDPAQIAVPVRLPVLGEGPSMDDLKAAAAEMLKNRSRK